MRYESSPAGLSPLVPEAAGRPGRTMLFVLPVRGGISVAARRPSGEELNGDAGYCVGSCSLFCRHHGSELEIPLYYLYRAFHGGYGLFHCWGVALRKPR